jgi:hypothetical protein
MSSTSWSYLTGYATMSSDQSKPTQISMFDAMSLLEFSEDKLYVSSLDVAHHFEKLHYNVLRSIEALE